MQFQFHFLKTGACMCAEPTACKCQKFLEYADLQVEYDSYVYIQAGSV